MVQRAVRSETERGVMATERLSMRQIREILRQKWTLGRTHRQVAEGLRVGLGTVSTVGHVENPRHSFRLSSSFYELIRPQQQRRRDRQAERLRGLEVDDQLELRRLFDR